MKRAIIGVVTVLVLGACGSGDEEGNAEADTPAEVTEDSEESAGASADEPSDEPADEPSDEPADEPSEEPADEPTDDGAGGDDGDDGVTFVDGLSDMPSECIDIFRDFLQEIEPIVSEIDWQQATFEEFGNLGADFEDVSTTFDTESQRLGCDRFDLSDSEGSIEEMIEFARDEAPGTVGFFEFIAAIQQDTTTEAGGDDAPTTCDEATEVIATMAADYGQLSQVPAAEFLRVSQVTTEITSLCTPAELNAFFEREDIAAFLGS